MADYRFSKLADEGIWSVAKRQDKNVQGVELDLTMQLREAGFLVADTAVKDWRLRGVVPREPRLIELLARYCVTRGRLNRAWGESLLHQARYPDREALLDDLFPDSAPSLGRRSALPPPPPRPAEFMGREAGANRVMQGIAERWPVISIFGFAGVGQRKILERLSKLAATIAMLTGSRETSERRVLARICRLVHEVQALEPKITALVRDVPTLERRHALTSILSELKSLEGNVQTLQKRVLDNE